MIAMYSFVKGNYIVGQLAFPALIFLTHRRHFHTLGLPKSSSVNGYIGGWEENHCRPFRGRFEGNHT
jgi:hypothetical protein